MAKPEGCNCQGETCRFDQWPEPQRVQAHMEERRRELEAQKQAWATTQRVLHENQDSLTLTTTAKGAVTVELKLYGTAEEIEGRATAILDRLRDRYKNNNEPHEFYKPK